MNWAMAVSTGFGLGLGYFGLLWIGIRELKNGRLSQWLILGRVARLTLAGGTFYALIKTGGFVALAAGLAGLLAARWYLIRLIGGAFDGR